MKFSKLKVGDRFVHPNYEDILFEKVEPRGASCCTPSYNSMSLNKKGQFKKGHLIKDDEKIELKVSLERDNVTMSSVPISVPTNLKRIINVQGGIVFRYKKNTYRLSGIGQYGGKRVPVTNIETNEEEMLPAMGICEIHDEDNI